MQKIKEKAEHMSIMTECSLFLKLTVKWLTKAPQDKESWLYCQDSTTHQWFYVNLSAN